MTEGPIPYEAFSSDKQNRKGWKKKVFRIVLTIVFVSISWFLIAVVWALLSRSVTGTGSLALGYLEWLILGAGAFFSVRYSYRLTGHILSNLPRPKFNKRVKWVFIIALFLVVVGFIYLKQYRLAYCEARYGKEERTIFRDLIPSCFDQPLYKFIF